MKHLHYAANEHAGFGELFGYRENSRDIDRGAYARNTDPDTSQEAAEHVRKELANRLEAVVLVALREHPNGLTNHGLVRVTGVDWNTITPRIAPLVRKGLVFDSGKRREGPTQRTCIVWKAIT